MKHVKYLAVSVFLFFLPLNLSSQLPAGIVKGMMVDIETTDGMNLFGFVESIQSDTLLLKYDTYGLLKIPVDKLKSVKQIKKDRIKKGNYWYENPNYSRNFYGPTGIGMQKGRGYYQNLELAWQHLAYAFTDYFTLGFDFEVISLLIMLSGENVWDYPIPITGLTPKFSHSFNDRMHAGLGSWMIFIPDIETPFLDFALNYGVFTYGNKEDNVTLGFGLSYFDQEFRANSPIFTLSGQKRVSRTFSLVTENWFLMGDDNFIDDNNLYLGVHGIRYLARKLTWDIGLILAIFSDGSDFVPLPYVGIAFPFEPKKNTAPK